MKIVRVQITNAFGQVRIRWVNVWRRGRRTQGDYLVEFVSTTTYALRLSDEDAVALALLVLDRRTRAGTITNSFIEESP